MNTRKELIKANVLELNELLQDNNYCPELECLFVQGDINAKISIFYWKDKSNTLLSEEELTFITNFYDSVTTARASYKNKENNQTASLIYIFSNENLNNLFSKIDVKDKNVLTVGSSGDQALNAIFHRAKNVTLADLNFITPLFVKFKIAAIKELSFLEFTKLFTHFESSFFENHKYYAKFSHLLDSKTRLFWDTLMLDADPNSLYNYFTDISYNTKSSFYNNEKDFFKLKKILKESNFSLDYIFAPIEEFHKHTTQKFDLIMLSNIHSYIGKYFFKKTQPIYEKLLNPEGLLQLTSTYREDRLKICDVYKNYKNCTSKLIKYSGVNNETSLVIKKDEESNYEPEY